MTHKTRIIDIASGLAGFLIVSVCAYMQKWEPRDLIWGFWGTSLIVGYIWAMVLLAADLTKGKNTTKGDAIFAVGFISCHFIAFHYFLSLLLLDAYFPLPGYESIRPNFIQKIIMVVRDYWALIAASLATQIFQIPKTGLMQSENTNRTTTEDFDPMSAPYRTVCKMGIMMFALVGYECMPNVGHASVFADKHILYLILIMFFIPWKSLGLNIYPSRNSNS